MDAGEPSNTGSPLYVFLDESGNLDFSAKGTNYFIVSAVITSDPLAVATHVSRLKYELLAEGLSEVSFHAAENMQAMRDRFYAVLDGPLVGVVRTYTMYIDKHLAAPSIQDPVKIMAIFGKAIARWLEYRLAPTDGPIIVAILGR